MALPTVHVTGHVLTPSGAPVSRGTVTAKLSQPGRALDGALAEWVVAEATFTLGADGALPAGFALVPSDAITPAGTAYLVKFSVVLSNGTRASWSERWTLSSAPSTIAIGDVVRVATQGGATFIQGAKGDTGPRGVASASAPVTYNAGTGAVAFDPSALDASASSVTTAGGSTARPLREMFADVLNVKSFGAKGDGTTNDAAAIQSAISAAESAGGGTVYFPPGTYSVAAGASNGTVLTVATGRVTLRGAGRGASILRPSAAMAAGHTVISVAAPSVIVEDLGFSKASGDLGSKAIAFSGATDGQVRRCWFDAKWGWSVFISGASSNVVVSEIVSDGTTQSHNVEVNGSSNCVVERSKLNATAATGNGVEIYDNAPNPVVGNVVRDNWILGPRAGSGVFAAGAVRSVIQGNAIEGTGGYGIFFDASEVNNAIQAADNQIVANVVRGAIGPAGIYVGGPWNVALRTVVANNVVTGGPGTTMGIAVARSDGAVVSGNVASGNGGAGIYVNATGANTAVTGNAAIDNSNAVTNGHDGIQIGANYCSVVGNRVTDTRGASAKQRGITILAGVQNTRLIGNVVTYAAQGPYIADNGTGTVKIGNYGLAVDKPSIAGSRAGNAALADLLTKLASLGLIVDGSTP